MANWNREQHDRNVRHMISALTEEIADVIITTFVLATAAGPAEVSKLIDDMPEQVRFDMMRMAMLGLESGLSLVSDEKRTQQSN